VLGKHGITFIYRPRDAVAPVPVIVFLHGLNAKEAAVYGHIVEHIASRGYYVVFPQYRMASFPGPRRTYRKLFNRIIKAVEGCAPQADTTRIGFVGHSFGAAAIPAFVYRSVTTLGWATRGAFMFIMAPHFVFGITPEQLRNFPPQARLLMQVYEEDDCNDHRLASHVFETISIENSEKDFMMLMSDSSQTLGYRLTADHAVPCGRGDDSGEIDGLDYYGIYRHVDALADYVFNGNEAGKAVALGGGSIEQCHMGMWADGTKVKEAIAGDTPGIVRPTASFFFNWTHPWNPFHPAKRVRRFLFRW
jgi:hypothetical protein